MSEPVTLGSGLTLNTRIDGDIGKPWIVLSNSLGANLSMWEPQIEALSETYRVLRYDTRGHGGSETPGGPYGFDDLVGDVIGVMDAKGIEQTSFMGLSMGGMTGLGLAIDHPDRFHRIICADGRADAPQGFRDMWDQRIAAVETGGMAAIVEGTLATWLTADWQAANPGRTDQVRTMVLGTDPKGYVNCCLALKGLDYLRRLGDAGVPVFYLGGSEDKGAAPEVMQAMADATPGGAYVTVPNAAHVANINAPKAFNGAIAGYLTS